MEDDVLNDPLIYPPEDIQKRLWFIPVLSEEDKAKLDEVWEEIQAA